MKIFSHSMTKKELGHTSSSRHIPTKNQSKQLFWLALLGLSLLTLSGAYLALRYGNPSFSTADFWQTLRHPWTDSSVQDILIDLRLPRVLAAGLVGAAMAIAGAIMQGLTRNRIADPGLLGINAGAGLAILSGYALWGSLH